MTMPTVIFSHGQESGPWGTKIRAMADAVRALGCDADSIDYQGIRDPMDRVSKLLDACSGIEDRLILVGSSMGGFVATAAAAELDIAGLFVLAPAFYMPGFDAATPTAPAVPVFIVHGWHDDIVPVENSIRYAGNCAATLHIVDGDHRLTNNIDDINDCLVRFIDRLS